MEIIIALVIAGLLALIDWRQGRKMRFDRERLETIDRILGEVSASIKADEEGPITRTTDPDEIITAAKEKRRLEEGEEA